MSIRLSIIGMGDVRRKLERAIGAAKAGEILAPALQAGAEVFGEEIQRAMPVRTGLLKRSIKKGAKGRVGPNGPSYFSAVDRKAAPQGKFLHLGTRRQKARPEIFEGAIRAARSRARNTVAEKFIRIQWDHL